MSHIYDLALRKGDIKYSTRLILDTGDIMFGATSGFFYRERAALVDADSLNRALRYFVDRTGCVNTAGKALVESFTVDLDVLANLMPRAPADLHPRPTIDGRR